MSSPSENEFNMCSGSRHVFNSDDDVLDPDYKIISRERSSQEQLKRSNKKRKRSDTPVKENEGTSTSVEESEGHCKEHEIKGSNKILFDQTYFKILKNCSTLWNKCNRPMTSEIINNLIFCSLKTTTVTRWNSLFDAITQILKYKEKLPELCALLHIPKFNIQDIEYLEQYCVVLTPIAHVLDFLQREENMYFGYFIATLVSLKVKLRKVHNSGEITLLRFVCHELQTRLVNRFKIYFEMNDEAYDAIVAAITCPNINLRFCNVLFETAQNYTTESVKQIFLNYAKSNIQLADQNAINKVVPAQKDSNFLDFGKNQSSLTGEPADSMKRELGLYLMDMDTSFECLKRYPRIREIFLKYNTAIPSSAPVERLFSLAGIINSPRRKKLTDFNFENLILLRANNNYV